MIGPAVASLGPSLVTVRDRRGHGAGVVWRPGLVVTARHVVRGVGANVTTRDGEDYAGFVVGSDPELDLAVLAVPGLDAPAAPIGDARALRLGEAVFALGHPLGRSGHATLGIVSGLGTLGGGRLQADLALAPGNSGGPLANARGEVVGIASMILAPGIAVATASHAVEGLLRRARLREAVPA